MILRARVAGVVLVIGLGVASATAVAFAQSMPIPDDTAADAGAANAPETSAPVVDAGPAVAPVADAAPTVATPPDAAPSPTPIAPAPTASTPSPVVATPTEGAAEPSEPSPLGFTFGIRAGYSFPFGGAKAVNLGDVVGGALGFTLELGYFLDHHIYVGGQFTYGLATNVGDSGKTSCPTDPDDSCSGNIIRFGLHARYYFRPSEKLDPWAGVGFGYDILNLTESASDGTTVQQGSLHGFELLNIQTGIDYKPRPFYGIGPYMELSVGHYAYDGSSTQLHEWFTLGLRLRTGV